MVLPLALLLFFMCVYAWARERNPFLQEDTVLHFEYGEILDIDPYEFIEDAGARYATVNKKDVDMSKGYAALGSYTLPIVYQVGEESRQTSVDIIVEDTTPPVITSKTASIDVMLTHDPITYDGLFAASDRDGAEITYDDSAVDWETPGCYSLTVRAEDPSGNTAEIQVPVVVHPDPAEVVTAMDGTPTMVNGIPIVNKKNGLYMTYAPGENEEAAQQLQKMIAAMQQQGLDVSSDYTGFISYEDQSALYYADLYANGAEHTSLYVAYPGFSEHQTGLAFDLKNSDGSELDTENEVAWLKEHAAEYGFIIRYPEGKEESTGFAWMPWHIRYLGDQTASKVAKSGMSLEEYLGIEGGISYY